LPEGGRKTLEGIKLPNQKTPRAKGDFRNTIHLIKGIKKRAGEWKKEG